MTTYTDSREEKNDIGAFANWFGRKDSCSTDLVLIEPLELVFHAGYLSMNNYMGTIDESSIICQPDGTVAIKAISLGAIVPKWKEMISLHDDFIDMQDC